MVTSITLNNFTSSSIGTLVSGPYTITGLSQGTTYILRSTITNIATSQQMVVESAPFTTQG